MVGMIWLTSGETSAHSSVPVLCFYCVAIALLPLISPFVLKRIDIRERHGCICICILLRKTKKNLSMNKEMSGNLRMSCLVWFRKLFLCETFCKIVETFVLHRFCLQIIGDSLMITFLLMLLIIIIIIIIKKEKAFFFFSSISLPAHYSNVIP